MALINPRDCVGLIPMSWLVKAFWPWNTTRWGIGQTLEHEVTIPFTRMLAGPMDYTPGSFHNATREEFKPRMIEPMSQGTRARQLAMYVVYEMPLAMLADYPAAYEDQPAFEFIERVPTVWNETKVLNGEPAKYITIARQHGETWYLGSMTNWDSRDLEVSLDFLGQGEYEALIFADGTGRRQSCYQRKNQQKCEFIEQTICMFVSPLEAVGLRSYPP